MKYDVEADFNLLKTCNFRCSYCFIPLKELGSKLTRHGSSEQWEEGFNATGKTWMIHVTGGEPFIYPGFVDLCDRLARRHYLSINSNLAHRSVAEFTDKIDPGRVHYINASLHFEERQKRAMVDEFIDRAKALLRAQFNVLVSVVMSAEMIDAFPSLAQQFGAHGLCLLPKVLRGHYRGKHYPEAYSLDQKARIRGHLLEARQKYAEILARMGEAPTIDMFADDRFLDGVGRYRGKWCGSGHNFVNISPNGDVLRCGSGERLGNILQRTVRLLTAPRRCDTEYCPYFCEKYTSAAFVGKVEERWAPLPIYVGAALRP